MAIVRIPVTWSMCGIVTVEIEEDSIEEFVDNGGDIYDLVADESLPDGDYVEGSFEPTSSEVEFIKLYQE